MNSLSFSQRHGKLITWITWIARIIVGLTFIFSGLVKAIDPWGTIYKIEDYLAALGWNLWDNLITVSGFGLCCGEFLLGCFILLGCFRRSTPVLLTIVMGVMLPLSLWIAIADPVDDCGCFGDAVILSNWATLWKNVVLTALIIWLLIYNQRCICIVRPYAQWIFFVLTSCYILAIALIGYLDQPLLDFRPYKEGSSMISFTSDEDNPDDSGDYIFVYQKDGIQKEFTVDDEMPDESEGWQFVERKEVTGSTEEVAPSDDKYDFTASDNSHKNLRIWSEDGNEDLTESVFFHDEGDDSRFLILMMPDMKAISPAVTWKINSLYQWSQKNDISMIAVVSGSQKDIDDWRDISLAEYPIYTADDTIIKEVVRGNPGVVYSENNIIVWKNSLKALQNDDFMDAATSSDPHFYIRDNKQTLLNISLLYLILTAALIFISYSPKLTKFFFAKTGT